MVPHDEEDDSDDGEDGIREAMDEAVEAGQLASGRKPGLGMWGAWIYDDGHAAMGGGVGGFFWFESRDDLLDYMREYLPFMSPTIQHRADAADVLAKCYATVDAYHAREIEAGTAVARLNNTVRGLVVVEWWGLFDQLLEGDEAFSCEIRNLFHGDAPDSASQPAHIASERINAFADFLPTVMR